MIDGGSLPLGPLASTREGGGRARERIRVVGPKTRKGRLGKKKVKIKPWFSRIK